MSAVLSTRRCSRSFGMSCTKCAPVLVRALSNAMGLRCRDEARRVRDVARAHVDEPDLCGGASLLRAASILPRLTVLAAVAKGFVSRDFAGDSPWSIRGLFAPGWGAPCFAEYMASAPVLRLVRDILGCGAEELMLPDADCILFMDVPSRDRIQAWHRDMRWAGEGGDYSEGAQKARWTEIQNAAGGWLSPDGELTGRGSPCGHNGYFEDSGGGYLRWQLALVDTIGTGVEVVRSSCNDRSICIYK